MCDARERRVTSLSTDAYSGCRQQEHVDAHRRPEQVKVKQEVVQAVREGGRRHELDGHPELHVAAWSDRSAGSITVAAWIMPSRGSRMGLRPPARATNTTNLENSSTGPTIRNS